MSGSPRYLWLDHSFNLRLIPEWVIVPHYKWKMIVSVMSMHPNSARRYLLARSLNRGKGSQISSHDGWFILDSARIFASLMRLINWKLWYIWLGLLAVPLKLYYWGRSTQSFYLIIRLYVSNPSYNSSLLMSFNQSK